MSFGTDRQPGDIGVSFRWGLPAGSGSGELDSLIFENDARVGRAAMSAGGFGSAAGALDRGCGRWRDQPFAQNQQHMGRFQLMDTRRVIRLAAFGAAALFALAACASGGSS
jgi:hypothetical protein